MAPYRPDSFNSCRSAALASMTLATELERLSLPESALATADSPVRRGRSSTIRTAALEADLHSGSTLRRTGSDADEPNPGDLANGGNPDAVPPLPVFPAAAPVNTIASSVHDGPTILNEDDCPAVLGFSLSSRRKWMILTVIFVVQLSMNFNASVYASGVPAIVEKYNVETRIAGYGQMVFLIAYGIGSELWAPWSEERGRWIVLQMSLLLVNITQIMAAFAPSMSVMLAARTLGGLVSAGGSVTLGMVADLWAPEKQQYAVAYVVLASVAGSALGPIAGGLIATHMPARDPAWIFFAQLIFGAIAQMLHGYFVPETRASVLLDREAQRRRKFNGTPDVYGPGEKLPSGLSAEAVEATNPGAEPAWRGIVRIWLRPFEMFVCEPIVLFLSLLSGFSDALIFTFLESYRPVLVQWNFGTVQIGLAFIPIVIGYIFGYLSFLPVIRRDRLRRMRDPDSVSPESRLWWLLWTAPLEAIGLFGFAWTSCGPPVHWIVPLLFSMLIAIANYSIYMATIDYMVASYGPFSASATGGNALARDLLAGFAALYSAPFYRYFDAPYTLSLPSTILGIMASLVAVPIYVFYWKGPSIRKRSKFALSLAEERSHARDRAQAKVAKARARAEAAAAALAARSRRVTNSSPGNGHGHGPISSLRERGSSLLKRGSSLVLRRRTDASEHNGPPTSMRDPSATDGLAPSRASLRPSMASACDPSRRHTASQVRPSTDTGASSTPSMSKDAPGCVVSVAEMSPSTTADGALVPLVERAQNARSAQRPPASRTSADEDAITAIV